MTQMSPVEAIFFASLEKATLQERAAYLAQACGTDADLRDRVERLLAAHPRVGSFMEQPAAQPPDDASAPSRDPTETAAQDGVAAGLRPDSGPPLPAGGSVLKALTDTYGGVPRVHLREPEGEPLTPVVQPCSPEIPEDSDPSGRIQLHGEIARGGMGAILKGHDTNLGRDIAVKVLLETHQGKTELAQRFVEEAQIAGQLQHPGVIPVYELGVFSDKRPYFTMKLVKGKTLTALLTARKDNADDRSRFVGIFAQVCQTLAYAHARGVIHRDLKPSNIMVGSFGEVQVMDWGLAKVLHAGGVSDERMAQKQQTVSVIRTRRSAGSNTPEVGTSTQAGTMLGTPAYMAPEQARGEVDLVDARADVFGLGAILCEILTGQPPFTGTKAEAMRKAQTAQLDDAFGRLNGCGAESELIGLARRCLAGEPWDRPRDSGEVAMEVTAFQNSVAERLRQAELANAAEVARTDEAKATAAQERKARRLTVGLAAAVLLLIAVGALGGLAVQRQWAERSAEAARHRQAIEAALNKAQELREQARWVEARAVLEQTRDRLDEAGEADLLQRLDRAVDDLNLLDRVEIIRLRRATIVEGKSFDNRTTDRDYAAAFREEGLGEEGEEAEAVAARVRDSVVREQLITALDDWAAGTEDPKRRAWLLNVARRADPDPWRDRFRDPEVWRDRAGLEALAKELLDDEKQVAKQKPHLLAALGDALLSTKADAAPFLAAVQARHPDDFWLNFDLGKALYDAKKWDEAVGFYRAAVAVRPSAVAAHNNLGNSLWAKKQLDEAIREFRTAIDLDPKDATAHCNLGHALRDKKQLDEAIREYRTAIDLAPKYAPAHNNLGVALQHDKKQLDEAIREFRTAIDLDPKNAEAHNNLGTALAHKKQLDEAIEEFRRAIDLHPKFAQPHGALGMALLQLGRFTEARESTRRCLELLERDDPIRQLATRQLEECEQLVALDHKLFAILEGRERPANDAERLALAQLCQQPFKKLYAAAFRFFAEAFAHDAKLADAMQQAHRYNAACVAALAGCGQGDDADKLDDKDLVRLRKQARDWLRADLAHWTKQAASDKPSDRERVQKMLKHWQDDADLAGIRDKDAVAKLPADEQEACKKLWAEVEAVLKKAQEKGK